MNPEESFRIFLARYIDEQTHLFCAEIPGVKRNQDIECLHRMRVASRRLRTALRIYGRYFSPRKVRAWHKKMGNTAHALGSARDQDVQIILLRNFLPEFKNPSYRQALEFL